MSCIFPLIRIHTVDILPRHAQLLEVEVEEQSLQKTRHEGGSCARCNHLEDLLQSMTASISVMEKVLPEFNLVCRLWFGLQFGLGRGLLKYLFCIHDQDVRCEMCDARCEDQSYGSWDRIKE